MPRMPAPSCSQRFCPHAGDARAVSSCAPITLVLCGSAKAHQRDVIVLAAAGGVLLDGLQDALTDRLGSEARRLRDRAQVLGTELLALHVHRVGDAVAENDQTV